MLEVFLLEVFHVTCILISVFSVWLIKIKCTPHPSHHWDSFSIQYVTLKHWVTGGILIGGGSDLKVRPPEPYVISFYWRQEIAYNKFSRHQIYNIALWQTWAHINEFLVIYLRWEQKLFFEFLQCSYHSHLLLTMSNV